MARVAELRATNTKRVQRFTVPTPVRLAKLSVLLDGLGSGVGAQVAKAVVYTAAGALVAVSDEVVVADSQALAWVDFRFLTVYPSGVTLAAGDYDFGLIVGDNTNTIQLYTDSTKTATGKFNTDTYSDGAAAAFGSSTALTTSLFLTPAYTRDWVQPDVDDLQLSRLPFNETQKAFSVTGSEAASLRVASMGWYGTRLDPERGAVAVVRTDGPLADLVGERLRLTMDDDLVPRVVYVYCHSDAAIAADEDIAVPPGIFARLGQLSRDSIQVQVEVLG